MSLFLRSSLLALANFQANCCGVGTYYTSGVVDILQWK
jgi:hypothetical protein